MKRIFTTIVALATVVCLAVTVGASPMARASSTLEYEDTSNASRYLYICSIYNGSYTVTVNMTEYNAPYNSYNTQVTVDTITSPNKPDNYTAYAAAGTTLSHTKSYESYVVASSGAFIVNGTNIGNLYGG